MKDRDVKWAGGQGMGGRMNGWTGRRRVAEGARAWKSRVNIPLLARKRRVDMFDQRVLRSFGFRGGASPTRREAASRISVSSLKSI